MLSDDRKTIDTFRGEEWKIFLGLKSSLEKVNWIKGLKNRHIWKKKTSSKVSTSESLDLFDNPVGYLTVLQFFRLKALQNCVF
jgi:hypothetical protein